jgi:hypothetical protein
MTQAYAARVAGGSARQIGDDDEEAVGYNAADEPAIRAFVLSVFAWLLPVVGVVLAVVAFNASTRALELAEDGLATNGGLAYAARLVALVHLWLVVAAVAVMLVLLILALRAQA